MNENKIYAAISGIDENILAASENAGAVAASFRAAKRKKTAAVLSLCACLLLAAVAAGMRIDTKKQIKKYSETVTPRPADYAALPVDVQNAVYAFDPDDLFALSGFSDHVAVAYVREVKGTVYQNVRMDEGTLKGTPYTSYEVRILKNIKGALKTDVTVPLLQYGGVTIDGARVAYISALLEQNRSYVLYLTAEPDGNLYVTRGFAVPGGNTEEGCRALLDGKDGFFEPYYNAFLNENKDLAPAVRYPTPYDAPEPATPIPVSTEVPETQTEAPDAFKSP